jgi:hypothetical protein
MHRWLLVVCAACGGGAPAVQIGPPRPEPKTERTELAPQPSTTGTLPMYTGGCWGGNELRATMDRKEIKKSDGVVRIKLEVSLERPSCGFSFMDIVSLKGEAGGRQDLVSASIHIDRDTKRGTEIVEVTNDVVPKLGVSSWGRAATSWWKLCQGGKLSYELTLRIHAAVEPPTDDKMLKLLVRCDA